MPRSGDLVVTAEAPVSWPSGTFVRVDRLDDEARHGIERSADFAAGIGSPVLTIHLFAPQSPAEFRDFPAPDPADVERFLRFYADACLARGGAAADRARPARATDALGRGLPPWLGGHWDDLLEWRGRIPALGFTIDTSHAALFRSFCAAYPTLFGLASDEDLDLTRYVEELGPAAEVATSRTRTACSARGCRTGRASSTSTPCAAAGELGPTSSPRSTSRIRTAPWR